MKALEAVKWLMCPTAESKNAWICCMFSVFLYGMPSHEQQTGLDTTVMLSHIYLAKKCLKFDAIFLKKAPKK